MFYNFFAKVFFNVYYLEKNTDSTTREVPKESAISITQELPKECASHLVYQFCDNYPRTSLYSTKNLETRMFADFLSNNICSKVELSPLMRKQ